MTLLAALAGCTHLATVDGAVPIAPGASLYTGSLQVARNPNPLSTTTGIPLPAGAFHLRRGLAEDTDLGIHVLPTGLGLDVRHRLLEKDGWSVAAQPGITGMYLPIPSFRWGWLQWSLPVRAEHALGQGRWSVAGGPALVLRQTFLSLEADGFRTHAATFELYAGGGARLQRSGKRVRIGVSADLYGDATRSTGLYGGLGFDLGLSRAPRPPKANTGAPVRQPSDEVYAPPPVGTP